MSSLAERNIKLLTWFNFFNDFRPYNPIAIIYFAQVTGSFTLGLMVFSVQSLSAILFELPTGIFSDMMGRKRTMVLGAAASVLSLIFYAIGGSLSMLAIGAIFAGLCESFFSGTDSAFLYDSLNQDGRVQEYASVSGKVRSMFQVGLGISALIGSVFAGISLSYLMWISVAPQIICLCIAVCFLEPKIHAKEMSANIFTHLKEAVTKFKNNYRLRALSFTSMIDFGIGEVMHQLSPAFLVTVWPVWGLGIARSLSHVFSFLGFRYAGAFIKKVSVLKSLIVGWIGGRLLVMVAVIFPTSASPILISVTSLFFGFRMIALDTLMQQEFSDKERATMGSLNRLGANILFAIFAYIFGAFADTLSPGIALFIGEGILLTAVTVYWRLYKVSIAK